MMPNTPVYQPVQCPVASLKRGSINSAAAERYGSSTPSAPSGSWNSLEPPMNTSARGVAASARSFVWRAPAEPLNRLTVTPGYAAANAAKNFALVDSFRAEYTERVPVTGAAVDDGTDESGTRVPPLDPSRLHAARPRPTRATKDRRPNTAGLVDSSGIAAIPLVEPPRIREPSPCGDTQTSSP